MCCYAPHATPSDALRARHRSNHGDIGVQRRGRRDVDLDRLRWEQPVRLIIGSAANGRTRCDGGRRCGHGQAMSAPAHVQRPGAVGRNDGCPGAYRACPGPAGSVQRTYGPGSFTYGPGTDTLIDDSGVYLASLGLGVCFGHGVLRSCFRWGERDAPCAGRRARSVVRYRNTYLGPARRSSRTRPGAHVGR